ncbi:hypothetical protein [Pseudalkalibacillus hwajinpoensis]|uniref:hypothetical protein n=1 Tax=Guptibacillus hwajinpoensis TaxID=208199 RepID=UPI001CD7C917|nr:hypothetical protein [Pseudalkalibacillus hwajinpoensis]MCA0993425.1 hypothetical protein [Pseudalkalibacillus hwajinpoensis]
MKSYRGAFLALVILFSGCQAESYDEETIQKATEAAESYMVNNFLIEEITLDDPYQTETGGMAIDGTVNQGEDFTINLEEDFTVAGLAIRSDAFPPRKKGCEERVCEY